MLLLILLFLTNYNKIIILLEINEVHHFKILKIINHLPRDNKVKENINLMNLTILRWLNFVYYHRLKFKD
jgi:hypothetical protein